MPTINLPEAGTTLPRLIERAAAGEEIIIAEAGRPLARLVPLAPPAGPAKPRVLGQLAGRVRIGPDFDDPLPKEMREAFGDFDP